MRAVAMMLCLASVLSSGCLAELGSGLDGGTDCKPDIEQGVGINREVLYPEMAGMDDPNPKATVQARAGQTVTGMIIWSVAGGEAEVDLDGAEGNITTSVQSGQNVWQVVVHSAPEGNVTLGLDGAPLAFGAYIAVIQLVASGCTPYPLD